MKPFQERAEEDTKNNYTLSEDSDLTSSKNLWGKMFWLMFEPDGPSSVQVVPSGEHQENWSYQFSHLIGLCVWGGYQVVVIILMLNVLISIMNTTYMAMWARADKEWKYSKTYFQVPQNLSFNFYFIFVLSVPVFGSQSSFSSPLQPVLLPHTDSLSLQVFDHFASNVKHLKSPVL